MQFTNSLFHNLVHLTAAGGQIVVGLQGASRGPQMDPKHDAEQQNDDSHLSDFKKSGFSEERQERKRRRSRQIANHLLRGFCF